MNNALSIRERLAKNLWMTALAITAAVTRIIDIYLQTNKDGGLRVFKVAFEGIMEGKTPYIDYPYEYPWWSIPFAMVPGLFSRIGLTYKFWFQIEMLAMELFAFFALVRLLVMLKVTDEHRQNQVLGTYLVISTLAVPILYMRLDLVIALCFVLAILAALSEKRGVLAPGIVALATAIKLTPLLGFPYFAVRDWYRSGRREAVKTCLVYGGMGIALAVPMLAHAGLESIRQVLEYHGKRGIQLESIYSSVILLFPLDQTGLTVENTYNSWNIRIPFEASLLPVTSLLLLLGQAVVFLLAVRGMRNLAKRDGFTEFWIDTVLACLMTLILTSKVLSPQYFMWVYPLAALHIAWSRTPRADMALWVLTGALTTLIFPVIYPMLYSLYPVPRAILAVRNLLLGIITVRLWLDLWRRGAPATA